MEKKFEIFYPYQYNNHDKAIIDEALDRMNSKGHAMPGFPGMDHEVFYYEPMRPGDTFTTESARRSSGTSRPRAAARSDACGPPRRASCTIRTETWW